MILPCLLITAVGFLGFLIPPASGEKISLGVTTLLSMTVFLMAISDSMPPNSDSVPIIGLYFFYCTTKNSINANLYINIKQRIILDQC